MMKTTSRLMACPCALTACPQRSATPTGESIAARRSVALTTAGMMSQAAMSQAAMSQRRRVADAGPRLIRQNFLFRSPPSAGRVLKLFADHAIDGATPGAAEEDRRIEDRQQQRELPAAARAREEISVACVPIGHDRHLHGEHERKRTREESHGERRATKKFQNAEKVGPGQGPREAERRQDILRHRAGEAGKEFHIAVVDDDRARAETDDGVAVGRNALVEPAEGGKYQPLRVDGAFRARVHWFPPACLSIRADFTRRACRDHPPAAAPPSECPPPTSVCDGPDICRLSPRAVGVAPRRARRAM